MEDDCVVIDMLVEQTSNLHCFEDALELVSSEQDTEVEGQVKAVGKLISLKSYSVRFIKMILSQIWGIPKGLKVNELERIKLIFLFPLYLDKKRVLECGPWSINREHLILKDVPSSISIQEVDFSTTTFWVRIIGLPRDAISESNVQLITTKIG
ncbi:hypothetical protein TorRG33x02_159830 [Trema orientale]|uniref:DUF4283 domain-containing protein n=1 Tax=Trema orientale TaxID=63057 RepID=A0A2P5ERI0_TREOI|nr:hypothetical protein TorRG33x02_159830 [Trema orientale]